MIKEINMKKSILIGSAALVILLAGCQSESNSSNHNNEVNTKEKAPSVQSLKVEDYYPIKENTRYIYDGKGNEYASFNVYVDYTSKNKLQERIDNGGTVMARVVELKDGKLTNTYSRAEAYYRENFLETKTGDEEILLMEPLKKGTTWRLEDSSVRTITNTSVDVSTPSGNYKAIEVTTEGSNGRNIDYYAKGVGLVKTSFFSEGMEVSSSLSKIEENAPLVQTITFYYPNIDDDKLYFKSRELSFLTNAITKKVLEDAYKENVPNTVEPVFSENTKINSLYLNKDNNLYIDLNQAFLTEMNAGAAYEGMILQSIVNTFGQYYGVAKVYLTIDNEPYSSGHIAMEKGDFFEVNVDGAIEIK